MWVGTFHGLCNRLLRAHHRDAGLPQTFQILDSADQLSLIKRLLKGAGIDDDMFPPRDVQRFINGAKEKGERTDRSEEHTSELQSLMRISYDVFCLKQKKQITTKVIITNTATNHHK